MEEQSWNKCDISQIYFSENHDPKYEDWGKIADIQDQVLTVGEESESLFIPMDGFSLLCSNLIMDGLKFDETILGYLKEIENNDWLFCRMHKDDGFSVFYYMQYPDIINFGKADAMRMAFMEHAAIKLAGLLKGQNVVRFLFHDGLNFAPIGDGSISLSLAVFCDVYYKAVHVDLDVPKITT